MQDLLKDTKKVNMDTSKIEVCENVTCNVVCCRHRSASVSVYVPLPRGIVYMCTVEFLCVFFNNKSRWWYSN